MKSVVRLIAVIVFIAVAAPLAQQVPTSPPSTVPFSTATAGRELPKPNYDLAFRWTSAQVGKYVFSTSVTPRWLEFSDRFWYDYETPAGRKWWLVDPAKQTKTPLWDNARMAAQLTRILRTPYDAQHLPITQIRFFDDDRKIRFSVSLPRTSTVITMSGEELTGMTQTQQGDQQQQTQGGRGGRGGGQVQGGRAGGAGGGTGGQNKTWWLEYELATGTVVVNDKYEPEPSNPGWAQLSPDKQTVVFARGQNLFMMDAQNFAIAQKTPNDPSVVEVQLTTDGEDHYGYAPTQQGGGQQDDDDTDGGGGGGQTQTGRAGGADAQERHANDKTHGPRRRAVGVQWSQDHLRFSLQRTDSRKVADLWVINSLSNPRPRLETYKYAMPGEENQPQVELHVFEIASRRQLTLTTDEFKDQQISILTQPLTNLQRTRQETTPQWLGTDSAKLFFTRTSRDLKRIDIVEADGTTGEPRVVVQERSNTYIEIQPIRLISGGKEVIHWSEKDGWGHYYLYDAAGKEIRQLTQGEFVTTGVVGLDETNRWLYFHAVGREPGEDPYYQHLYRTHLDKGGITLLTPGDAMHSASMDDKAQWVVSNASRVDSPPEATLYNATGTKIMTLEKTDVSRLLEAGYKYPEPFHVKADDGITDLYGVMYKPFDFDPNKRYPIIEFVYPGPQTESVTKTFSPRGANVMLAQFGFIVIEVGNRGGHPQRSKWYHNYGYGNLRDYGLADKKAAVEQLAKRHPWIDGNLVGIYGHSGGGFMSTAAMLVYPDFFKVAVSTAGNHDNSVYNRWWSEKHHGVLERERDGEITFEYSIDTNQDIAKNLKGKLLLMHGDMDNNVHPAGTYRVIDALIRERKRFDFHLIPGKRHGFADAGDWVNLMRADYFSRHLLGWAPTDTDMFELQREIAIRR